MAHRRKSHRIGYFASSFAVVLGIVLIWRGIWYILEWIDMQIFGGAHWISVVAGIILGFIILYLPDKDLSELRKL